MSGQLAAIQSDFDAWLRAADTEAATRFGTRARHGLDVYQNNYRSQLMTCLEEALPKTLAWLGETDFRAAASQHVDAVPPSSWTLDDYPLSFPDTLTQIYTRDAEVVELARLEIALTDVFVGPDAAALTSDMIAKIDWDRAILHLVPACRLLAMTTNAATIWSRLNTREVPPPATLLPEVTLLAIWRRDGISCFRELEGVERPIIMSIEQGASFSGICAALVEEQGEHRGITLAGTLLARWAGEQLLARPD